MLKDGQNAGQLKNGFRKHHDSLAPMTKPEAVAIQTSGLRTVASLKPKYHCLNCSEVCLKSERKAHTKKTGHVFCMFGERRSPCPALTLCLKTWSHVIASCFASRAATLSTTMVWKDWVAQLPSIPSRVCHLKKAMNTMYAGSKPLTSFRWKGQVGRRLGL